jgi:AcrR family transcriptional regulator
MSSYDAGMPESSDGYHHGALREALVSATEALLAERGAEGFSLREVARRAGVSPAAPAHHFGDAAGLLTAVASLGFEGLTRALERGDARGGADPRAALREQGMEYVRFACDHPGRFRLMFRSGVLRSDADLERHGRAAFEVLARGVRRLWGVPPAAAMSAQHGNAVIALWSLVHGYAHLAIAGKFGPLDDPAPRAAFVGATLVPALEAMLEGLLAADPLAPEARAVSAPPARARPGRRGPPARSPARRR